MGACLFLAKQLNLKWLREWALGIAILTALVLTYVAVSSGLFAA